MAMFNSIDLDMLNYQRVCNNSIMSFGFMGYERHSMEDSKRILLGY